jgi:RNA polymerase sigma factor (sigma-70 family)
MKLLCDGSSEYDGFVSMARVDGLWNTCNPAAPVGADDRNAFVAAIVREHGQRLRRYLRAHLPNAPSDVADLEQEVYLCLLRTPRHHAIQSPRAYLFTVARHVLCKHHLTQSNLPESLPMMDLVAKMDSYAVEDPGAQLEVHQRFEEVDQAVRKIAPQAYATFVLRGRFGFTLEEIAGKLGVSRPMIKKYFSQVVGHCRKQFDVRYNVVECDTNI